MAHVTNNPSRLSYKRVPDVPPKTGEKVLQSDIDKLVADINAIASALSTSGSTNTIVSMTGSYSGGNDHYYGDYWGGGLSYNTYTDTYGPSITGTDYVRPVNSIVKSSHVDTLVTNMKRLYNHAKYNKIRSSHPNLVANAAPPTSEYAVGVLLRPITFLKLKGMLTVLESTRCPCDCNLQSGEIGTTYGCTCFGHVKTCPSNTDTSCTNYYISCPSDTSASHICSCNNCKCVGYCYCDCNYCYCDCDYCSCDCDKCSCTSDSGGGDHCPLDCAGI